RIVDAGAAIEAAAIILREIRRRQPVRRIIAEVVFAYLPVIYAFPDHTRYIAVVVGSACPGRAPRRGRLIITQLKSKIITGRIGGGSGKPFPQYGRGGRKIM